MHESAANPLNQQSVETTLQDSEILNGARILLTEDNRLEQPTVSQLLEEFGALVTVASSGLEAVEFISSDIFDLVLMDLQMPGMDGYEATNRIRALHQGKDLPIIAMTAHAMKSDRERSIAEGMNGHITKPVDPNELINTLSHWLGNSTKLTSHTSETEDSSQDLIPSSITGIDLIVGLKNSIGDQQLYHRVLNSFYSQFNRIIDVLKSSPTQDEGRHISHSLKGVCSTIGAAEISAIAAKLEISFRDGEGDTNSLIAQLESRLTPLLIDLEKIFPHNDIENE